MQRRLRCAAGLVLLFGFGCGAGDDAAPLAAAPAPKPTAGKGPPSPPPADPWERLEAGLEIASFQSRLAVAGDRRVNVLRIDPSRFRLRLLNASSEPGGRPRTVKDWSERLHLTAAINASMYQADMRSSVSLMLTRGHVNNPRVSKDKAVLAFDPLQDGLPPVQIIDRECQDFEELRGRYGTLVQSIRMVSCEGRNVWEPQQGAWSTAAIGVDKDGRVLFIHARAPHTTHDLIQVLLELPLRLKNAMYVEGGSEAQMFVQSGGRKLEFAGAIEDPPESVTAARLVWPIPNAIGIEAIAPQPARR